jgi:ribonucleoside-diphosphate reductase subunit M1
MVIILTSSILNPNILSGIKTTELDNLIAETAAYLNILHPDFGKLGARVAVTKIHKETSDLFFDSISSLFHYTENDGKD